MNTIIDNIRKDAERIKKDFIRAGMPAAKMLNAEICLDLSQVDYTWGWAKHKIAAGLEKDFIKSLGMEACKKSDATALLIIGEQIDGHFITGKAKRHWIRQITNINY